VKCRPGVEAFSETASPESREGRRRFQVIEADESVLAVGRLQLIPLAVLRCDLIMFTEPVPTPSISSDTDPASVTVEGVGTVDAAVAVPEPPNIPSTFFVISSKSSAHAALAFQSS
jgi:hypothetical protein